jgi:hypothetical protein
MTSKGSQFAECGDHAGRIRVASPAKTPALQRAWLIVVVLVIAAVGATQTNPMRSRGKMVTELVNS